MRIVTFNVQRLRMRIVDGEPRLDGARDGDSPRDGTGDTPTLDWLDRSLTAEVLKRLDGDVVALQEVFDQAALDHFHDAWLLPTGTAPYPHRICIDGNDGRGFDVALMSRLPVYDVRSHKDTIARDIGLRPLPGHPPSEKIFRRDCLSLRVGPLRLYICHFKAPYPDIERAWELRQQEALAVRKLIERDTRDNPQALWMIVGDLNEPSEVPGPQGLAIDPVRGGFSVDLVARIPENDRWSYQDPATGAYSRPDAMLASPSLAALCPDAVPFFMRAGMEWDVTRYDGPHLAGVGGHRPHASDHAALAIDLPLEPALA